MECYNIKMQILSKCVNLFVGVQEKILAFLKQNNQAKKQQIMIEQIHSLKITETEHKYSSQEQTKELNQLQISFIQQKQEDQNDSIIEKLNWNEESFSRSFNLTDSSIITLQQSSQIIIRKNENQNKQNLYQIFCEWLINIFNEKNRQNLKQIYVKYYAKSFPQTPLKELFQSVQKIIDYYNQNIRTQIDLNINDQAIDQNIEQIKYQRIKTGKKIAKKLKQNSQNYQKAMKDYQLQKKEKKKYLYFKVGPRRLLLDFIKFITEQIEMLIKQ